MTGERYRTLASDRKNPADDENATEATDPLICDRCDTDVRLTEATVSGDLTDPEEVICPECTEPEDRFI